MNTRSLLRKVPIKDAKSTLLLNLPYWIAASLSALVAVFYARIFAVSEEWGLAHADENIIYIAAPLSIIFSFLIGHFLSKEALGSGIPQAVAAAELAKSRSPFLNKLLGFRMILAKILGSCVCVFGGGATGREGPTIHVSSAIFYQILKFWPRKWSQPTPTLMVMAGGSAGLAAAFNTPLGGVVFAIEEISKSHISQVRTTVFQAVIIAGVISQMFLGDYLYLGEQELSLSTHWSLVTQSVFIAAVVGLGGALFAEVIYRFTAWRAKQSFMRKFLMTVICAIAFMVIVFLCGKSSLGSGKTVMMNILSHPESSSNILLPIGRIFGNLFTYIGGVIGGIFAPALASGATLAQWLSIELGFESLRTMMLVGMVAFLTGVTRTPFTAFVLVLEMSDTHEAVLYLMISSFVASIIAKSVSSKGFYEKAGEQILQTQAAPQPQQS